MFSSLTATAGGFGATTQISAYTPDSQAINEIDQLLKMIEQPMPLDDLATFVRTCFEQARSHRQMTGVDAEMDTSFRAYNNQYEPDEMDLVKDAPIYMGITNLKCRALQSWVKDILANNDDKPWALKATPMPELPAAAEEAVVDRLMLEVRQYGDSFDKADRASVLKSVAYHYTQKLAASAVERMERKIHDHMVEGGWRAAFGDFVTDLSIFPNAFLKGPVVTRVKKLRWSGNELGAVSKAAYRVKRVSPYDVFPSPNSTTTQDGAYIIERQRLSQEDLLGSIGLAGFQEAQIRYLVSAYPEGLTTAFGANSQTEEIQAKKDTDAGTPSNQYECIVYYGKLPARMLAAYGITDVGATDDFQGMPESEVWVCGDRVIRAILNPHPLGTRPISSSSFSSIPGSFWGRSLPKLLRDVQRVCNASSRALVKNMAFSAGPIGEYDINRLANEQKIEEVRPYRMYAVETDQFSATTQPAIKFNLVPSVARQVMQVYDAHAKYADDISGIPAYILGNPQVAGAGRTMGGLALLMGNAAKGVKAVIADIDKRVIEPVVGNYYTLLMMYDSDRTAKADAAVHARGSAGLLQKELSQARAVEVLQMLTPYAASGDVPREGLQLVIRDVLRGLGYNADEIVPDPMRKNALASLAGTPGQASGQPAPQVGTAAAPVLDGRSALPADTGNVQIPAQL